MMKIREENLNIMLAELLAESGLKAIGEVIIRRKRMPDVLLDINGIRIIIEGKYPGKRKELYETAYKRIDEGLCDVVMMVEYAKLELPSNLSTLIFEEDVTQKDIKEVLRSAKFNVGFVTYIDRVGLERWVPNLRVKREFYENVDFSDLVGYLMSIYDYVIRESFLDPVIKKLEDSIFSFAEKILMTDININRLKQILELEEGGNEGEK